MGATTVAAALSDFQAISQTVGTLKGETVGADNLADELSSDLESQEAVVDKPVTAIVIGAGARGRTYASYSEHYPNSLKIVGVADINTERKEYMKNLYRIPDEHCFSDWKEVFNVPKFADAVIIATPDNLHYAPALKAMAAGYDLLLEKPVAQSIKECTDILKYAKRYDRIVGICHVLRYAPYFIALKKVLDSGKIGELVSIQHMECIRYHHMAHSYVRGHDSHHYREIVPRYGYDAVACEQTLQIGIGLWRFETVQEGECARRLYRALSRLSGRIAVSLFCQEDIFAEEAIPVCVRYSR